MGPRNYRRDQTTQTQPWSTQTTSHRTLKMHPGFAQLNADQAPTANDLLDEELANYRPVVKFESGLRAVGSRRWRSASVSCSTRATAYASSDVYRPRSGGAILVFRRLLN